MRETSKPLERLFCKEIGWSLWHVQQATSETLLMVMLAENVAFSQVMKGRANLVVLNLLNKLLLGY